MKIWALFLVLLISSCSSFGPGSYRIPAQVVQDEVVDYDSRLQHWEPVIESLWERLRVDTTTGFYENSSHAVAYDLLKKAKKSIDIEIYEMKDPMFRRLLVEALERGVKIRIVKDSNTIGDSCDELDLVDENDGIECQAEKSYINLIQSKGAQYVYFDKKQLCGIAGRSCFQHGKMIIVDNRYLLLSSGNFNSSSLCAPVSTKCNRDFSYLTKNAEIIRYLRGILERDMKGERWEFKKVISQSPPSLTISPESAPRIVSLIRSAKKSIWVQNQYLEDPAINNALIDKAQQGLDVHVQVSAFCSFGMPSDAKKLKINKIYTEFDSAGIKTRIFTSKIPVGNRPGYLHSKALLIDEKVGWIGSINGSETSSLQNREFGIIFKNQKSIEQFKRVLQDDFNHEKTQSWMDSVDCKK